jgi:hypothetical protein
MAADQAMNADKTMGCLSALIGVYRWLMRFFSARR